MSQKEKKGFSQIPVATESTNIGPIKFAVVLLAGPVFARWSAGVPTQSNFSTMYSPLTPMVSNMQSHC